MGPQDKYTYSEFKAWQKVNAIMGIETEEAEPKTKGQSEVKSEISAATKSYLAEKKNPNVGLEGRSLF